MIPRVQGFHHHMFGNLADVQTSEHDPGDVLTLDEDLKPGWAAPESGPHDIISTTHTDTDTGDTPADGDVLTFSDGDNKWHPAPASGGGITAIRTYVSFGCDLGGETFTP